MPVQKANRCRAEAIFGYDPILHAVGGRQAAGHVSHAAWRADRRAGEGPRELCAGAGQHVDVGRMHFAATVCAGGPGPVVVGHEHDYIGAACGGLGRLRKE